MNSLSRNRIFKFLFSGGLAALTEYAIFVILVSIMPLIIANPISFMGGFLVSFHLNKSWVFRVAGNTRLQLIKYFVLAMINLVLSTSAIIFVVNEGDINQLVAKLIVMVTIAAWNYIVFQKFIFYVKKE